MWLRSLWRRLWRNDNGWPLAGYLGYSVASNKEADVSNHLYNEYWAHTSAAPSCEAAQPLLGKPLSEHLEAVAQIAEQLASLALPGADGFIQEARLAGLLNRLASGALHTGP